MNREERNTKLKHFITCLKCEVSGRECDDNCPVQYEAGNMGEIIENLEAISKILEQEPKTGHWIFKKRMTGTGGKYYTGEDENGETHTIHVYERSCCDVGYCSECGKRQGDTSDRYCCYCGSYNGDDNK